MFGSANSEFQIHQLEMRSLDPVALPSETPSAAELPGTAPADELPRDVVAFEDWSVPAKTNVAQDGKIEQDLAIARDQQGLQISKTQVSGMFWLFRKFALEGDFLATARFILPDGT